MPADVLFAATAVAFLVPSSAQNALTENRPSRSGFQGAVVVGLGLHLAVAPGTDSDPRGGKTDLD